MLYRILEKWDVSASSCIFTFIYIFFHVTSSCSTVLKFGN